MAPEVGLEPTTPRLTAACSTIELLWIPVAGADGNDRVSVASKSFSRILCQTVRNPWARRSSKTTQPHCPRVFCARIQGIHGSSGRPQNRLPALPFPSAPPLEPAPGGNTPYKSSSPARSLIRDAVTLKAGSSRRTASGSWLAGGPRFVVRSSPRSRRPFRAGVEQFRDVGVQLGIRRNMLNPQWRLSNWLPAVTRPRPDVGEPPLRGDLSGRSFRRIWKRTPAWDGD